MSDIRAIASAAARLREEGASILLATVVDVRGPSYRRRGARMILAENEWIAGSVSGGCLELDVARRGWWRTREAPALVTYDANDDGAASLGLGCGGSIDILLERVTPEGIADPLRFISRCIDEQTRGAIATVFRSTSPLTPVGARVCSTARGAGEQSPMGVEASEHLARDVRRALELGDTSVRSHATREGDVDVLVDVVRPPARLFVFGTGHDALPLVEMARVIGWDVVVCETRPRFVTRFHSADEIVVTPVDAMRARIDACDRAIAVVMNHHYETDRETLAMLLGSRARYIGMLGPQRRTRRMFDELRGVGARIDARVRGPVGLALGAESPAEIALSIVAEIQASLARAPTTSLRAPGERAVASP